MRQQGLRLRQRFFLRGCDGIGSVEVAMRSIVFCNRTIPADWVTEPGAACIVLSARLWS